MSAGSKNGEYRKLNQYNQLEKFRGFIRALDWRVLLLFREHVMQFKRPNLRIARTAVRVSSDRAALPRTNDRKSKASLGRTVDICRITWSRIAALTRLILTMTSSVGALLSLIFVGFHLCPMSLAIELFRKCAIVGLSSELISVFLAQRSRR